MQGHGARELRGGVGPTSLEGPGGTGAEAALADPGGGEGLCSGWARL